MDANKKICLDEASVRLLRSLRSERLRMGLTQKELGVMIGLDRGMISKYECGRKLPCLRGLIKLSEIFGYDLSSSVNHKYFHGKIEWWRLRQQLTYYGFTRSELSGYIGYHVNAVCTALRGEGDFSLDCLSAILEILENEHSLLKFRNKLLRRKTPSRREWWKRTKSPAVPNSGSRDIWSWPF